MKQEGTSNWLAEHVVTPLHRSTVASRRIRRIAHHLASLLPEPDAQTCLDVGCGSGEIAQALHTLKPNLSIAGVDVLVRPDAAIAVHAFDGCSLPFGDGSFDYTILSDVLHHTDNPADLLRECARVARRAILVKDHIADSRFDFTTLRFMDWVGNRGVGVYLPYNYLSTWDWSSTASSVGLVQERSIRRLSLYPVPFSWLFDRNLHFVARFSIKGQ